MFLYMLGPESDGNRPVWSGLTATGLMHELAVSGASSS